MNKHDYDVIYKRPEYAPKGCLFAIIGIALFWIALFTLVLMLCSCSDPQQETIHPSRHDTTLSGMHYAIWTEPRTGDIYVINVTLDSLRNLMFKDQIK